MKIQSGNSIEPGPCDTFYLSYETLFKTSTGSKSSSSKSSTCRLTGWNRSFTDFSVRCRGCWGCWGWGLVGWLNRPYPATYVPKHEITDHASNFSSQTRMALDISGSIISIHRVLGRLQIGTLWTDMCWNGGNGNSLLAQVLRNQVSLSWVSRWPESEPALQALDPRWDTYSSTSRPWEKTF